MRSGSAAGQRGVSYLMLLVALAIIGVSSVYSIRLGVDIQRRWAEDELLRVGSEFDRAFASFRAAGPALHGRVGPRELEDLLRDPRFPSPRRHLRKLYGDPLTGRAWGILRAPDGSIAGVFSIASGRPLKQQGFDGSRRHFNEARSYGDWLFGVSSDAVMGSGPGAAPANGI